jgi:hypothetical protein
MDCGLRVRDISNGWTCVSCSKGCMCMLLIWVYMREYILGVYDVDDGCEVYFDGMEVSYSVADGEGCSRGTRKESGVNCQIMNHTPSAWYRTSTGGV